MLRTHKEACLSINGAQSLRLEKTAIEFKSYFKQTPVPFKIYGDSECNLKSVERFLLKKNIKATFLAVLLTSLFVLMINLPSQ